ncbi:hypothetical protein F511_01699 [Dorcoceras hygrometricum]|nr:hypothetical protein F511_01699 [Dorcoceras hygrometricum]
MSPFDLQDVCIAIGSLATLDLPMIIDLIGIYVLKGPYCTLTTTKWFLQALSVIPRGSWRDVARRFTMILWANSLVGRRPHPLKPHAAAALRRRVPPPSVARFVIGLVSITATSGIRIRHRFPKTNKPEKEAGEMKKPEKAAAEKKKKKNKKKKNKKKEKVISIVVQKPVEARSQAAPATSMSGTSSDVDSCLLAKIKKGLEAQQSMTFAGKCIFDPMEIREINWAMHFLPKIDPTAKGKEIMDAFSWPTQWRTTVSWCSNQRGKMYPAECLTLTSVYTSALW